MPDIIQEPGFLANAIALAFAGVLLATVAIFGSGR
jgi:hypothetical protein